MKGSQGIDPERIGGNASPPAPLDTSPASFDGSRPHFTNRDWKPVLGPVSCIRLFADENGESHFEDIETELSSVQYAPPAPALDISEPTEARQFVWLRFPRDWHDDAHPSPRRQLFVALEGEVEVWTSRGETRLLRAGDRLLMEDTSGKGHGARPVNGEALGVMIALE